MKYSLILLAAGKGTRTDLDFNKIFIELNGQRLLDYSLNHFINDQNCSDIVLVVSKADYPIVSEMYKDEKLSIILGGSTRQQSTLNALKIAVNDYVLVHDAARPFITKALILDICSNLSEYSSITPGVKAKDSIHKVDGNRVVTAFDRNDLIQVQTPQGFNRKLLLEAHKIAVKESFVGTDDTVLMHKFLGINAFVVEGDYRNVKLTTKEDIKILEVILNENRA